MTTPADRETIAIEAARVGGTIVMRHFRTARATALEEKGLHDFVTEVDHESDRAITALLNERCPDDDVMSEEGAPRVQRKRARWIVDPLDGTTNFAHGIFPFAVSVAVEDEQGLVAGAVYDPLHDEMFHARRRGGARLNGETIRCSRPADSSRALVATGVPFRELSRLDRYLAVFERVARRTAGLRRAGAAAVDLAYTACGRYDGFFEIGLAPWDVAGGILLVREAGGTVTDLLGGETVLETGDIVAGGSRTHAMLLAITSEVFAGSR
ncbi:MAG TPA: inositol monophosphatase family protein [Candidatus Polarisedimenticolaceae bacterium]|nr:inositol monophosphatase family protein [Candidatus Polarisedimenticolaceae bacterium]